MLGLSSDSDICASVSHDAAAFPMALGKPSSILPPLPSPSPSHSFSPSASLQLGHPGLQERDSPWWNRGRQLFLQPHGHYLKSDRDSGEWTWEKCGGREEDGREEWGQLCRCIVQRRKRVLGDKWIQQAFGTHRRLLIDPDRSIQAGLREAWEFSEGVNNLAAQLSCPIHQRQRPNQGWIPFSVWGGGSSPPPTVSGLAALSVSPFLLLLLQPPHSPSLPLHRSSESDWNDSL